MLIFTFNKPNGLVSHLPGSIFLRNIDPINESNILNILLSFIGYIIFLRRRIYYILKKSIPKKSSPKRQVYSFIIITNIINIIIDKISNVGILIKRMLKILNFLSDLNI